MHIKTRRATKPKIHRISHNSPFDLPGTQTPQPQPPQPQASQPPERIRVMRQEVEKHNNTEGMFVDEGELDEKEEARRNKLSKEERKKESSQRVRDHLYSNDPKKWDKVNQLR